MENQQILEGEPKPPSIGGIYRWLIIVVIIALLLGGGYSYYSRYIVQGLAPAPSPEVTVAIWKVKSEKTTNDFIRYWQQAKGPEARGLLTIGAQAKLETLKDKLTAFVMVESSPTGAAITSTKKIDEKTIEITVRLSYNKESIDRLFIIVLEGDAWLIDSLSMLPSSTLSPNPSASDSSIEI